MNMFADLARKATTLSPIMEGRDKISVAEIIESYPEGVTINSFDMIATRRNGEMSTYPVFTFTEDDSKFGFGGTVLKSIVEVWLDAFDDDQSACNAALKAQGGCKCKFARGLTKEGRNCTIITPVAK